MLQCQKLKGFRGEEDLVLKTVVNIVLEMKKTTEEKGREVDDGGGTHPSKVLSEI